MSVAAVLAPPPSYCTGRVGSVVFTQRYRASWLAPCPDSFPSDQMMIDGWLRSRCTMRVTRSLIAGSQRGSSARRLIGTMPCVSILASSTTYSP
ncbi:hypothetical protein D3C75_1126560 [compost metagenome]